MKKRLRYYAFLLLITPICLEIALRILGYSPYQQLQYSITSKPKMCLVASSSLGFSLGEGTFDVSVNGAPNYRATHRDGQRITRIKSLGDSLPKVFIMGCSFTYGMGVNDSESFPFQVQSWFPDLDVRNFGVPGFGNIQSYLQLKKELKNGKIPELVVVNFCDFHHQRNSLTPRYRNSLVMGYQRSNKAVSAELMKSTFPFVEENKIKFVNFKDMYTNWSGRELFATVNYFQTMSDEAQTAQINQETNSFFVFLALKKLCENHGIHFMVNGLTRNASTKQFLAKLSEAGIEAHDISLDLTNKQYNQLPFDTHPNKRAHDHFAKKTILLIASALNYPVPAN